jgi:riboflavin kinase/FMN adenylyltransferase
MLPELTIFRGLEEARGRFGPSVLTIGNFDGVHVGHRELFHRLVALGQQHRAKPSVLTFDPHPARVVAPAHAPKLLSTLDQRAQWMRDAGIQQVLVLPFDRAVASLSPEDFVRLALVEAAGARAVLVGENFRFGHRQAGDTELLDRLGKQYGFTTEIVRGVSVRGRMVSSTAVRGFIEAGEVRWAARLLGRPYGLEGDVVPGHGIGSKQTVPTLNLHTDAEVLPASGVYVTSTADLDGPRSWPSVTNIGTRPTFGGRDLSIETFLLAGLSGAPPARIRVEFHLRLRSERRFADPAELKAQILRDASRAQSFHRRTRRWVKTCV